MPPLQWQHGNFLWVSSFSIAQSSTSAILLVVISTGSYCCFLISYSFLFISAFDFSFLNAASCTVVLELVFWTLLEFIQINSSLGQPSKLLLTLVVHRLSDPSSNSLMKDPSDLLPVTQLKTILLPASMSYLAGSAELQVPATSCEKWTVIVQAEM